MPIISTVRNYCIFFVSVAWIVFFQGAHAQAERDAIASKPADVRLVIDVSGSMKRNDPNNLRQPSVDLLVQLLPEGSKAGVWTFGQWVNMLVPHKATNADWRSSGSVSAKKINSVGLYTNIGGALEKAAYDAETPNENYQTSIILLTDGMVDIDQDPDKNRSEWRRIVDEVLPKIQQAGYRIHTIGLSDNADIDLLNKLSISTDGIAEIAYTADDLMRIFLKAFEVSAPAEKVPFEGNSFVIDSSVEEFTALIFRQSAANPTELIGPDDVTHAKGNQSRFTKWYSGANYDLVTIKQPLEGEWRVLGDIDPGSRVTVVSNLNLRVSPLPNNVYVGSEVEANYFLQEDGSTVTNSDFLALMDIRSELQAGNDEFDLQTMWSEKSNRDAIPADGIYTSELPKFDREGVYQLEILVDGKSFIREFTHQFTVRQPFGAEIRERFEDGKLEYILTARSYSNEINFESTQVLAVLYGPNGRKKIRPLLPTGLDTWQATIIPDEEGVYRAEVKVKGETKNGDPVDVQLEDIDFNYSIENGFVEEVEPFFEATPEPQTPATPESQSTPTSAGTENNENVSELEIADTSQEAPAPPVPAWLLYVILGVGNLLLIGLGYFAYRKIMGGNSSEDILDEFSDEKIEEKIEEEATEDVVEEVDELEEEPPMEDLEVAESVAEEVEDIEPKMEEIPEAVEEDVIDPPQIESIGTNTDEVIEAEEAPVEDEMDDLDKMAMEQDIEDSIDEELSQEDEEEDMVAAMLKAQGLDLAEEELDDAISSLIEDLDRDDEEK